MTDVDATIREVIETHGRLQVSALGLSEADDLFTMGLTSHACVNVMLALEDEFDVEFPDELLRKSTFESVAAIRASLAFLGVVASTN
ncbi:MAG TPA: acyl carrier protein [Acidimicrobiales bacterium]|nr:acyl carrier protein [Acidimicrobiales bacterium]